MRLDLFEFEDFSWFPGIIRQGQTDYLHFVITKANIYKPAVGLIKELIDKTGATQIIDLCSGGGGGTHLLQRNLEELTGKEIKITLSDKYPNIPAFEKIQSLTNGKVDYVNQSVDALNVPGDLKGMRTMFSAFHHFNPADANKILKSAVTANLPIAIFEGADKSIFNFLGILFFTPIMFFIFTPFMKPFRLSRLFFTYIIPVIPLTTLWDGLVSILRMYSPDQMLKMAEEAGGNYEWTSGKVKGNFGNTIMYLMGYPKTDH